MRLAALLLASLSVACGSTPVILYAGPPLGADRISILHQTSRSARIIAIDDGFVSGTTFHLAPGERQVWAKIRMHETAGDAHWVIWTHCKFHVAAKAGREYELIPITRITETTAEGKHGEIGATIVEVGSQVAFRARTCIPHRPTL